MSGALEIVNRRYKEDCLPSYYITDIHRLIKNELGLNEPFAQLRADCRTVSKVIAADVEKAAAQCSPIDRFKLLMRWSVISNYLDFRTVSTGYGLDPDSIGRELGRRLDAGLDIDQSDRIYDITSKCKNIVFVPDNVGELAFDVLLVRELILRGASVTVPLRGGPITSDATYDEGIDAGFGTVGAHCILAGPDTLGLSMEEMTPECMQALDNADCIIAKGQANWYLFSEFASVFPKATIVSLLVTKCSAVSSAFASPHNISIAAIIADGSAI